MAKNRWWILTLALGLAGPAAADSWDVQTQNDNGPGTETELLHGSSELHDLGALPGPVADQDWFRLYQKPFSSWEIVAESTSGDIGLTLNLDRIANDGSTVLQSSAAVGIGYSRTLRWQNPTASAVSDQYIRVTSGSCSNTCGPDDVYRIKAFETTYAVPRFNNFSTQITVLIIENTAPYTVSGTVYFWGPTGNMAASTAFSIAARNTMVVNTFALVPGIAGAMTVVNDGRYGDLAGKTVALEPASGFSFDSPMLPRPH